MSSLLVQRLSAIMKSRWCLSVNIFITLAMFAYAGAWTDAGVTSSYVRGLIGSQDMPIDSDAFHIPGSPNAPQQVHITQGDYDGRAIIVSWARNSNQVAHLLSYGPANGTSQVNVDCNVTKYTFASYNSGFIHHCLISDLTYNSNYTYKIGQGNQTRDFWFSTPPEPGPDVPYTFGVIGDLGQTFDSKKTFDHYKSSSGQTVLYVGDLSYADNYPFNNGVRWDTWGRFVEPSAAYQPWIWVAGNHEIEFRPDIGETEPFKPFLHRYATPYLTSSSASPLWYAVRRASAHIIVLSSYSAYGKYTPQWIWLRNEFKRVNRNLTPWLIVLMHAPLYNSNSAHYMEGEGMRAEFETWFLKYKVDIVFAGHVHAYERSHRISSVSSSILNGPLTPTHDKSAPVYVTIGDGGNIEGLATIYKEPQPNYSAFREASFGHAMLEIKNRTLAYLCWHRNDDQESSIADEFWLQNQIWGQDQPQNVNPRRKLKKSFMKLKSSTTNEELSSV